MNVPEGVQTVAAEGGDLKTAIATAAEQLGLQPGQVDYKLDMSHFRSVTGLSLARSTVRIVAWNSGRDVSAEPPARAPRPPRPERAPRSEAPPADREGENGLELEEEDGDSDRRRRRRRGPRGEDRPASDRPASDRPASDRPAARVDRPERDRPERDRPERDRPERGSKPESLRGAEEGTTEASDFAQVWFAALLEKMGVQGTTVASGSAERVHLAVKADRAGRIVGKRGATLGSIRHLLSLALEQRFGPLVIDVDVGDERPREEREPRAGDRGGDRERSEHRGDRDRDRDRGGRGRDRGGRGRDRRDSDRDRDRGRYPEEKLRALAQRAAEKARETRQTITINLELNSFDRRIVHLAVSELEGVESQSEERAGPDGRMVKYVQIIPT